MAYEIKNQRAVSCGAHIVQETCEVAGLIRIGEVFAAMRETAHHGDDPSHILKLMHSIASLAISAGPQMIALRHITSKPTSRVVAPTSSRPNNDPFDATPLMHQHAATRYDKLRTTSRSSSSRQ